MAYTQYTKKANIIQGEQIPDDKFSKRRHVPAVYLDELQVFELDKRMLARYININFNLTVPELTEKLRNCECAGIEAGVIAVLLRAIHDADHNKLEWLLSRVIGKVETKLTMNLNESPYAGMSLEELVAKKDKLDIMNRRTLNKIEGREDDIETIIDDEIIIED